MSPMRDSDPSANDAPTPVSVVYGFAGFRFDPQALQLSRGAETLHLERKPLQLLRCLLERAGEVVSKTDLHQLVWPGRVLSESVLTKAMARLRQALGPDAAQIVRTIHGYGYRFDAVVTRIHAPGSAAGPELRSGQKVPRAPTWMLRECLLRREDYEDWLALDRSGHRAVYRFVRDPALLPRLRPAAATSERLQAVAAGFQHIEALDLEAPPFHLRLQYCSGGSLPVWVAAQGGFAQLSLDQRLRLFSEVAAAVANAHVIGELVGALRPDDLLCAGPEPRVCIRAPGFRIDDLEAAPDMYVAPERVAGGPASTRTDTYALGVLLFQFVVGDFQRVFAPGWEASVDDVLLREDIAAAAASDPTLRIASVQALSDCIRSLALRHRDRATEEKRAQAAARAAAESDQMRQRIARLEQRRRWLRRLSATAAVGLLVAGWGYRSAVIARHQAEQQAIIAEQVSAFLTEDVLRAADPLSPVHSQSLTALLEQAESRATPRFQAQPVSMAHVLLALALAWEGHGEWQRAAGLLDAAADLLLAENRSTEGPANQLALRIAIQRAEVATLLADFAGAETRYRELQQYPAAVSPVEWAWLPVHLGLAYLKYERGLHAESAAAYENILGVMRARGELGRLFDANWSLPDVYLELGRAAEAQAAIEEVIQLRSAALDPDHPEIWWQRLTLGDALAMQGRLQEADALYQQAEAGLARRVGPDHPYTLTARHYRGHHYLDQGDFRRALPLLQSALQGRETVHGPDHLWTLYSYTRTGEALLRLGDSEHGLPLLETAYARAVKHFGEGSPHTLEMRMSLAEGLLALGEQDRGQALIRGAEPWVAALPLTHIRKRRWEHLMLSLPLRG